MLNPGSVVFLHGLESTLGADGRPVGRKANYLRARFGAVTPPLDTSVACAVARSIGPGWRYPFSGYEEAFATPLLRAREAIGPQTRVVVGSSFGGAVLLRLLHESPSWRGPALFLAGAGVKLTHYRSLPGQVPVLLVHGREDVDVPPEGSALLAASSSSARLLEVDDEHRLASIVNDLHLGRWVEELAGSVEAPD